METLKSILEQFDKNREANLVNGSLPVKKVADCFMPCAKKILCGGYFLIENKFVLDIKSIELYYHEEEGCTKDHIMYHTNERKKGDSYFKRHETRPYFDFASFNMHPSGVDVTFENRDKNYRASFLIRSFRVLPKGENLSSCGIGFDECSTHIYDEAFYMGIPFGKPLPIEWIPSDAYKDAEITRETRLNVAEYRQDGKYFEKIPASKEDYMKDSKAYFNTGGKYYKQCQREWRFTRK